MLTFVQAYGKEIVALVVPVVAWVLNSFLKPSVRLVTAVPHSFTFLADVPAVPPSETNPQGQPARTNNIVTRSVIVFNDGREVATKLELVFNWKPHCFNVWPARHITEHIEADRRYVIIIDSLAPKEVFGCELLSVNEELPNLVTVRCDQCVAQSMNMFPQPVLPIWQRRGRQFFALAGLGLVAYALIVTLQWLVLQTPLGR